MSGLVLDQFLDNLIISLNSLDVRGEQNLNVLLGCILAIKQMKKEIKIAEKSGEDVTDG